MIDPNEEADISVPSNDKDCSVRLIKFYRTNKATMCEDTEDTDWVRPVNVLSSAVDLLGVRGGKWISKQLRLETNGLMRMLGEPKNCCRWTVALSTKKTVR